MSQKMHDNKTQGDFTFPKEWTVFGPLGKDAPEPDFAKMTAIPKELAIAGKRLAGQKAAFTDNRLDLGALLGGKEVGKTAYLLATTEAEKAMEVELGAGADWWMKWWVNGAVVCDTSAIGNNAHPPSILNHRFTARLKAGRNLIAVKVVSGQASFVVAAGESRDFAGEAARLHALEEERVRKIKSEWRGTTIAGRHMEFNRLPSGLKVDETLALVLASPAITGQVVYSADRATGTLFETRATKTPGGDYLLMFPTDTRQTPPSGWRNPQGNSHYGHKDQKVNDMVAFRSSDNGKSWQGPTVAFDIDYNQHGFVPLIPRGSKRIYAFGTQPVWGLWDPEMSHGKSEDAPIGYRYSDDDGHHWSEVRLIRPQNDPGFLGMSVMRMCETDSGAWILGSHEGDRTYKQPGIMTRQYVLRSEDQGATWTVLPHPKHGGWCVPQFNRMDEGRPINLGGGEVYMMIRTCEGHLWATRSLDDGKTWEAPAPTPLVHPDAPPMLFHLSDGKTLAAFHHNRYSEKTGKWTSDLAMNDRSEIWVSLSTDGGRTWSVPRFVFANAAAPTLKRAWYNSQCSYVDAFTDNGLIHLFVPHRWQRCLHLQMPETELQRLPTAKELS